jgi:predicted acylesterase/phospholipase RssA
LLNVSNPQDFAKHGLRLDFFGIKEHEPSTQWFQYLLPQSLRNISDALIGHFVDKTSILRLDTDHLKHVFIQNIGLQTFQEAFDRTGRIINITVSPNNSYDPPRLLNYLTAPHVCIWSAAVASCAIPGVFDSISLVCKEPSGEFYPENEWYVQEKKCFLY